MSKPEHSKSVQSYCFFLICAIGCSFCHNNPIKIGQVKVKTKTPYESFSVQTRMCCPTTTLPLLSLIPLLYLFFLPVRRSNYARLLCITTGYTASGKTDERNKRKAERYKDSAIRARHRGRGRRTQLWSSGLSLYPG